MTTDTKAPARTAIYMAKHLPRLRSEGNVHVKLADGIYTVVSANNTMDGVAILLGQGSARFTLDLNDGQLVTVLI